MKTIFSATDMSADAISVDEYFWLSKKGGSGYLACLPSIRHLTTHTATIQCFQNLSKTKHCTLNLLFRTF